VSSSPDTNEKVCSGRNENQWHFPLDYTAVVTLVVFGGESAHGGGANLLDEGQVLSGRKRQKRNDLGNAS
jgi:hypothetical protein